MGDEHSGGVFSVHQPRVRQFQGGGIRGGRIIGQSDARAEKPATTPFGPEDLSATMYHLLGIDPKDEFKTPDGRPVAIVNGGRVMDELL